MKEVDFVKQCFREDNMFPSGVDAQKGLDILVKHFLGHTPIISYPGNTEQWNSEAIALVLHRYPEGSFRKIPKSR